MSTDVKLAVVTYTTEIEYPQIRYLTESMQYWGWPEPEMIALRCGYQGHPHKLACVKSLLPDLQAKGYTHALYTDCWDVICTGPFHRAEYWCVKNPGKTLLSADYALWPCDDITEANFPKNPGDSPFRYVNGGGWLGDIGHLLSVLLEGSEAETVNDQWHLTRRWLKRAPGVVLDEECDIFQCLSQVPRSMFEVFESRQCEGKRRVLNNETQSLPLLIHGAGGADMSWVPTAPESGPWKPFDRYAAHPANPEVQKLPRIEDFRPRPLPT